MTEWRKKTENYSDIFKEHVLGELYTTTAMEVSPDPAEELPIGAPIAANGAAWDAAALEDVVGLLGRRLPAGTAPVLAPVLVRGVIFDKNQLPWLAVTAAADMETALAVLAAKTMVPIDGDQVPYDFGR